MTSTDTARSLAVKPRRSVKRARGGSGLPTQAMPTPAPCSTPRTGRFWYLTSHSPADAAR